MPDLDFSRFEALTFDCYGTLIDWETGILGGLRPSFESRDLEFDGERLLDAYGKHEAALESGPYLRYRDVLAGVIREIGAEWGFSPTPAEVAAFVDSIGDWPAFPDTVDALGRLKARFRLGVITNCDDDLFARTSPRLGVTLDWIVTAQQAGSYKPSHRNFELALDRLGLPRDRVLHVAQSLYHDHVPAAELGLSSVWIDRRRGRAGTGATRPAVASPSLAVPDMATFADLATRAPGTAGG